MSMRDGMTRDEVQVLAETLVDTPSMARQKKWVPVATVKCRATPLTGTQAQNYQQFGFKIPWIFQFLDDVGLTPINNRLLVTPQGETRTHLVEVRNYHNAGGTGSHWVAEGDEITQRPPST
jgi:hypothetical protein